MKRKILKVGMSSLAVSLPAAWAKEQKVRQGDELDLSEREGGLFLHVGTPMREESITIEAPGGERFIRRIIISPYIQGYNEIIVDYKEPATRRAIEEVLQHITGFEIVGEKRGQVTLKNVAQGIEEEFTVLFHRMFHLVATMGDLLADAVSKRDLRLLDELDSYEHTLTKLHNFCRRLLNLRPHLDLKLITSSYRVISELEGIGDQIGSLSKHLREIKRLPDLSEGVDRTVRLLHALTAVYFAPTVDALSAYVKETRATERWLEQHAKGVEALPYIKLAGVCHRAREVTVEIMYPFKG